MSYLLDTVVFLWIIFDQQQKLTKKALTVLKNEGNKLYISSASAWEISVKYSIGKLEFKKNPVVWLPDVILKMGLIPLPVSQNHAFEIMRLPLHHRDPFDRLLVSQSKLEKLPIVTPDSLFKKYKISVIW